MRAIVPWLLLASCADGGLSTESVSQGILGGTAIAPESSSFVELTPGGFTRLPRCSAAMVTNDWLITARHCFDPGGLPPSASASMGLIARNAFEIVRHPTADVAMVHLGAPFATPAGFERGFYRPASATLVTRLVQCFGYGLNDIDGVDSGAGTLRTASGMPVVAFFGPEIAIEPNAAGAIPAPGDSGGPCLIADGAGRQVVAGVISRGAAVVDDGDIEEIENAILVGASDVRTYASDAMTARELRLPNGTCLDVPGSDTTPGAQLQGFPLCHGAANQRWRLVPDTSLRYAIQNVATGQCVDIPGSAGGVSRANQFPCNGGLNQRFTVRPDVGGGVRIIAAHAGGGCLGVAANGALEQHACPATNVAESWTVTTMPERGHRTLQSVANGECVDVPFGSSAPNVSLNHFPCHDGTAQELDLRPTAAGASQLELRPRNAPALCLEDQTTLVRQTPCAGIAAQRWRLRLAGDGSHLVESGIGRCLALPPAGSGTNLLVTQPCAVVNSQRWRVRWF